MIFDQTWMAELLELQKKAAEIVKGKNFSADIQSLVTETLNKWGINGLSWDGDLESKMWNRDSGDIDISETKNNVLIKAFIPGIGDKNELLIKLCGGILTISGECNQLNNDGGSFNRQIRLPMEVTASGAKANYRDGNLTILLPKKATEDGEIIPVNFLKDN